MAAIVDVTALVLILGMTWALMSEGLWGAALMFFNILFAAVLSFNFYEPLAGAIAGAVPDQVDGFVDMATMTLMFLVLVVLFRVITESLAPTMVRFPNLVYNIGRVAFGLAGATLVVSVMLLAFHMAPIHKKMFGSVDHDTKPPFGMALDRRFLAFFQHTTGNIFTRGGASLTDPEFGDAHVFDRQGRWLLDHEDARPFGEGWREQFGAEAGTGTGAAAGGTGDGLGIPGGTAGAAAGLAPTNTGF